MTRKEFTKLIRAKVNELGCEQTKESKGRELWNCYSRWNNSAKSKGIKLLKLLTQYNIPTDYLIAQQKRIKAIEDQIMETLQKR